MSNVLLEAETRTDMGKGASRRLRRLENKVPAIIYGGDKDPKSIHFLHNKVVKALETESIYSSVFDITVDGKVEHVILKAVQRHPYKSVVMHMDLQRVSLKDVLVKFVPVHFINEEKCCENSINLQFSTKTFLSRHFSLTKTKIFTFLFAKIILSSIY